MVGRDCPAVPGEKSTLKSKYYLHRISNRSLVFNPKHRHSFKSIWCLQFLSLSRVPVHELFGSQPSTFQMYLAFHFFESIVSYLLSISFLFSKILLITVLLSCLKFSFYFIVILVWVWKGVKVTICAQSPIFMGGSSMQDFCVYCQLAWSWLCYQKKPIKHGYIPCFLDSNLSLIIKCCWFNIKFW